MQVVRKDCVGDAWIFSKTSDKKDFISGIYDESDDYFYVDGDLGGAEDKISYGSGYPEEFGLPPFGGLPRPPQQPPSLTERISEAVFSPLGMYCAIHQCSYNLSHFTDLSTSGLKKGDP